MISQSEGKFWDIDIKIFTVSLIKNIACIRTNGTPCISTSRLERLVCEEPHESVECHGSGVHLRLREELLDLLHRHFHHLDELPLLHTTSQGSKSSEELSPKQIMVFIVVSDPK